MTDKIPNSILKQCAIEMMATHEMPMEEVPTRGRSMIFSLRSGETVRLRTSNDPVLVVTIEPASDGPKMNIEGTDYLLFVMPEETRTWGAVKGYLVPTRKALKSVRETIERLFHDTDVWPSKPTALSVWFNETGRADGNYDEKWSGYLIDQRVDAMNFQGQLESSLKTGSGL